MAIDTTAGTVAQNMLNGIDYSALIGGPLQAAISAQAMAATTYKLFALDTANGNAKIGPQPITITIADAENITQDKNGIWRAVWNRGRST